MSDAKWKCPECGMTQLGEHGPNALCSHGYDRAVALGWASARREAALTSPGVSAGLAAGVTIDG